MQDTNQPPHPANNDYAVANPSAIIETMYKLFNKHKNGEPFIDSEWAEFIRMVYSASELLEKLKS